MMDLEFYIEIFKSLLKMLLHGSIEVIAKWIQLASSVLHLE